MIRRAVDESRVSSANNSSTFIWRGVSPCSWEKPMSVSSNRRVGSYAVRERIIAEYVLRHGEVFRRENKCSRDAFQQVSHWRRLSP